MCENENSADSDPYPDASGDPYSALLIQAMNTQPGIVPAICKRTGLKPCATAGIRTGLKPCATAAIPAALKGCAADATADLKVGTTGVLPPVVVLAFRPALSVAQGFSPVQNFQITRIAASGARFERIRIAAEAARPAMNVNRASGQVDADRQRPKRIVRLNRDARERDREPTDEPDRQRPKCSQNGEYGYNDMHHQLAVPTGELYVCPASHTISGGLSWEWWRTDGGSV